MRKLTKLQISEVSLVPEGANDGARVMIYKMNRTSQRNRFEKFFRQIDFSKLKTNPLPVDDDDDIPPRDDETGDTGYTDTPVLPEKLRQAIAALILANPKLSEQDAAWFCLHNPHGRALVEHLSKQQKGTTTMTDRAEGLRDIAKQYGVARIAKMIVMENTSHGITESELTQLASEEFAKQALPGERPNTTFSGLYNAAENVELRKAFQIAKNAPLMTLQPVQVGGADATDVNTDKSKAYQQLVDLAEEQRRRSPELSSSQAFARVFEANPELAARAARRPVATTSYAYPT
jgi:hypothetical protein